MDTKVKAAYDAWKAARLAASPSFVGAGIYSGVTITDGYHVQFADPAESCRSEGQGYGMLILVLMAGYESNAQAIFDGLFKVARARPAYGMPTTANAHLYLMEWRLYANMGSAGGGYNASDGDLDIALALLMAHRQWGSGGAINYWQEAQNTIAAIKAVNFASTGEQYLPQNLSRTSDYMIGHFRSFKAATGDTFWDTARTRSAALIAGIIASYSATYKLVPDFIYKPGTDPQPSPGNLIEGEWEGWYGPNACRVPWRWGTDYVWSGDATWKGYAKDIVSFIQTDCAGNPFNGHDGWMLNGAFTNSHTYMAEGIHGPAMVGCMVDATFQSFLNTEFTTHADNFTTDYYDSELQLLPMIVASGNWWRPL
jgi:endo-1,4-beta-D-glucanase Y